MPLANGIRLGPYEILAPLGAGGMGEVYRARDTRLDRTVAIKVLPPHLSSSEEVRQRFEREAKTISSLSHPHICALYDVGHQDGTAYLVMEYLEGETLADRIAAKGALPTEQTLRYGIEIADALDKAHRQGIVHRDLKPGNVMLTKSGVKLLDFGLAKAVAPASSGSGLTALPTVAGNLTQEGTILGTFQYMAPEQLEGKEADARTDIFAFGAVLYEMATGRKAFEGKSQASLISAIMSSEPPPISALQPMTPPALERVVKTCLAKDPEDRWQSARDIRSELDWIAKAGSQAGVPAPVVTHRKSRERIAWSLAALFFVAAAFSTLGDLRRAPKEGAPIRFLISPPDKTLFDPADGPVVLSPDGRRVAFGASDAAGETSLWVQSLDSLAAKKLDETDEAYDPFWSPDGRYIAFGQENYLWRREASGGPRQKICEMTDGRGGSWNRENIILFTTNGGMSPLFQVPASGGAPEAVTALDKARGDTGHWRPQFLPDGRHFLFLVKSARPENSGIYIGSLDSKETTRLTGVDVAATYGPPGFLLFVRERTLLAQPFDPKRLVLKGEPVTVAKDVQYVPTWGSAAFSAQRDILVSQSGGGARRQLVWFARNGSRLSTLGPLAAYSDHPRLSPAGKLAAIRRDDAETRSGDIWVLDVARGTGSRLTFDVALDQQPVWSPDGARVVFSSNRGGVGNLHLKGAASSQTEELLLKSEYWSEPLDWSPDGRVILYRSSNPTTGDDLWLLPLNGKTQPLPFSVTPFWEGEGRFSPDGRWIAYTSNETGRREVYVAPFPPSGEKRQVSTNGGGEPRWRGDGRELFFATRDDKVWAVEVRTVPPFEPGLPKEVLNTPGRWGWDVSSDGQRFLVNIPAPDTLASPISVVLNWTTELNK